MFSNYPRYLYKLMAVKDEYEVARLYSQPEFRENLARQFEGDVKLGINLGTPVLALGRKDKKTGRPKKVELGQWIFPVFSLMAKLRVMRGTALDPFGYAAERRMERALIGEYEALVMSLAGRMTHDNAARAAEISGAASLIRGYGPIKEEGVVEYRALLETLLPLFEQEASGQAAERATETV